MRMSSARRGWALALTWAVAASCAGAAWGQNPWEWRRTPPRLDTAQRPAFPGKEFTFCRIMYTSPAAGEDWSHRYRGRWSIDFPESDRHFSWRLSELTTIKVKRNPNGTYHHVWLELTDPDVYNYPFIYMLEVGALEFSEAEVEALRNYLLRGGFLMVDDFWGEQEWLNWEVEFSRVLDPDKYPMEELDLDHPIFNCVFKLDEKPQVPSAYFWLNSGGRTSERGADSAEPRYLGVYDRRNGQRRLMAVICHNTDLGDGWEREGQNVDYFNEISAKKAYPMGINIVVYALTHGTYIP